MASYSVQVNSHLSEKKKTSLASKWLGQVGQRMVTTAAGFPCSSVPFLAMH